MALFALDYAEACNLDICNTNCNRHCTAASWTEPPAGDIYRSWDNDTL